MEHIRKLPSTLGDITLNSVSKSVHTCCCGKSLRHSSHHIGINYCNYRNIVNINTNHLSVLLYVGNYVVDSNLCCGSCSGGNCNNRNTLVLRGSNALKRTNVCIFRVGYDNCNSLCGIHGRTASDSYDAVCSASLKRFNACLPYSAIR